MRHALIIDDIEARHEAFRRIFRDPRFGLTDYVLHHAYTVAEALAILQEARSPGFRVTTGPDGRRIIEEPPQTAFSIIFLDHDCEATSGPDFNQVVRHIMNDPKLLVGKPRFFVHSQNPVGAANMAFDLRAAGYEVRVCPFSDP